MKKEKSKEPLEKALEKARSEASDLEHQMCLSDDDEENQSCCEEDFEIESVNA